MQYIVKTTPTYYNRNRKKTKEKCQLQPKKYHLMPDACVEIRVIL